MLRTMSACFKALTTTANAPCKVGPRAIAMFRRARKQSKFRTVSIGFVLSNELRLFPSMDRDEVGDTRLSTLNKLFGFEKTLGLSTVGDLAGSMMAAFNTCLRVVD